MAKTHVHAIFASLTTVLDFPSDIFQAPSSQTHFSCDFAILQVSQAPGPHQRSDATHDLSRVVRHHPKPGRVSPLLGHIERNRSLNLTAFLSAHLDARWNCAYVISTPAFW
ncbi:hypothetical protein DFP72DRAFT_1069123 [Ephemerocybe angulata]|uniref:Uncharacterized protein n=1 Tax=Ephemerocybe angulata TaxID=980116 RepID=A0A8H6HX39_9AGAR|nr:hypothetical protein DFP72DRAFT_1069123 [Tulosesus angulatus]